MYIIIKHEVEKKISQMGIYTNKNFCFISFYIRKATKLEVCVSKPSDWANSLPRSFLTHTVSIVYPGVFFEIRKYTVQTLKARGKQTICKPRLVNMSKKYV